MSNNNRRERKPLVEKYRPKTFDEFIDQEKVVQYVKNILERVTSKKSFSEMPHLLFYGPPGVGKTTLAHIIYNELRRVFPDLALYEFNASVDRGIQMVREKICRLAMTAGYKIILLDECDYMTEQAFSALRRIMETTPTTRFILTCNYIDRVPDPIKSRCCVLRFDPIPPEKVVEVLLRILQGEGIVVPEEEADKFAEAIAQLYEYFKGDLRAIINQLEAIITAHGTVTADLILSYIDTRLPKRLIDLVREGQLARAIDELREAYINARLDTQFLTKKFFEEIIQSDLPDMVKGRLLARLADVEDRLRRGCDPIIQFAGLLGDMTYTMSLLASARKLSEETQMKILRALRQEATSQT